MKNIPPIGWVMLLGTGIPTALVVIVAILDRRDDIGLRVFVGAVSTMWFLTIVGICIYARHQERKGEEQLKQSGGK